MLDVFGNVEITLGDGRRGNLVANGRHLVLEVEEPGSLVGLAGRRTLRRLAKTLASTGITLHVRSGERLLLAAGRDVEPGLTARMLKIPNARIEGRFALRSLVGRRSAAA